MFKFRISKLCSWFNWSNTWSYLNSCTWYWDEALSYQFFFKKKVQVHNYLINYLISIFILSLTFPMNPSYVIPPTHQPNVQKIPDGFTPSTIVNKKTRQGVPNCNFHSKCNFIRDFFQSILYNVRWKYSINGEWFDSVCNQSLHSSVAVSDAGFVTNIT